MLLTTHSLPHTQTSTQSTAHTFAMLAMHSHTTHAHTWAEHKFHLSICRRPSADWSFFQFNSIFCSSLKAYLRLVSSRLFFYSLFFFSYSQSVFYLVVTRLVCCAVRAFCNCPTTTMMMAMMTRRLAHVGGAHFSVLGPFGGWFIAPLYAA